MQKRFSPEEADIANTPTVQNLEGGFEVVSVDPSQVLACDFAIREITKIAGCVARICNRNIAERGTSMAHEAEQVPCSGNFLCQ